MVDNFDIIDQMFYFNDANNMFFHLQVLRRGKDHPELPAANKLIQTWLVRSRDHLQKIKDEVVFLCEHYKARAYINVAGKDFNKLNELIMLKLAQNQYTGNVINPWHVFNSACGELKSRAKRWIVDIDSKDEALKTKVIEEIDRIWLTTHPADQTWSDRGKPYWLITSIPTMNGVHLITQPFNMQAFKSIFSRH